MLEEVIRRDNHQVLATSQFDDGGFVEWWPDDFHYVQSIDIIQHLAKWKTLDEK